MQHRHPSALVRPLVLSVVLAVMVAGCSNSKFRRTPQAAAKTPWFCEMNETHDDWDCVQDAELVKHPKPKRLPGDEPELPGAVPTIVPTVTVMGDSDSGLEPES